VHLGIILLSVLSIKYYVHYFKQSNRFRKIILIIIIFILSLTPLITITDGVKRLNEANSFYTLVDNYTIESMNWINIHVKDNETIGCAGIYKGSDLWPLGWWVQGYTNKHIMVGVDTKWLTFAEEKANANIINKIFNSSTIASEKYSAIIDNNIKYLYIDTRTNENYKDLLSYPKISIVYSNKINIYKIGD
jgi:hypothetical protein